MQEHIHKRKIINQKREDETVFLPSFWLYSALQAVKAQGTVNVEITDANWATYWLTDGVDFTSNSDIAAYKVTTVKESTVELSLVTGGVAGDIVIVAGLEGVYKVNVDPNATPVTGNLLKVSAEDVVSNGNYYGLKLYNGVLGFYRTAAGNEVLRRQRLSGDRRQQQARIRSGMPPA